MQGVSSSDIAITVAAQTGRVELLSIRRVCSDHCVTATGGHVERFPHDETKGFAGSMVMDELSIWTARASLCRTEMGRSEGG